MAVPLDLVGATSAKVLRNRLVRLDVPPCPEEESNLHTWLRRPVLYPLSYQGSRFRLAREPG